MTICAWCERPFEPPHRRGPKPKYCSAAHRQRAYEVRCDVAALADAGLFGVDQVDVARWVLRQLRS